MPEAAAHALGTYVRITLDGANAERLICGSEGGPAGRIVEGLCETGVNNPVFILEAVDRLEPDAAWALLYLLDPARRTAFRDAYLDVAFDLSAVLWIVTATDPGAIPEPVREDLAVIELPACTEEEKLAIAQQHLLTRRGRKRRRWPSASPPPSGAGFVKLACGGLCDETEPARPQPHLEGGAAQLHPARVAPHRPQGPRLRARRARQARPGPGRRPPLDVLDPAQHHRFHDAFVELPFDRSEVLFITTDDDPDRILLRDRLAIIDLPGYAEAEKVSIAWTHLIDAQKRATGLEAAPLG